ncbi:hypothetical protein V494_02679 [Pseudogymnoascus sp. VKM F-4513 (FW-928)]|nr:hypothetical protein V494_02679 [Pseudogymnoascus sp. VKM F-4513 (FW-928)]
MALFSFLSHFVARKATDEEGRAPLLEDAEEAPSGSPGIANKRYLTPQPPANKADPSKLSEAKPRPPTPTIPPLVLVPTSPSVSSLDLGVPLHPAPKTVSSPRITVAEGVWVGPSALKSKMTPSDEHGAEVKMVDHHPGVTGDGEVGTRAQDGVVGGLMVNAKKAFQSLNPSKAGDPETSRRNHLPGRANRDGSTELGSFMERLRLGDKDGKEDRSHEGYITLGSDDGEDDDVYHSTPSATKDGLNKGLRPQNYKEALGLEYKKANALPVNEDDEEERAKREFRQMYYKKKALAHRQKQLAHAGEDVGSDSHSRATGSKGKPLAQQENVDEYVDADNEWKPYVPEKDDDEWEFAY